MIGPKIFSGIRHFRQVQKRKYRQKKLTFCAGFQKESVLKTSQFKLIRRLVSIFKKAKKLLEKEFSQRMRLKWRH